MRSKHGLFRPRSACTSSQAASCRWRWERPKAASRQARSPATVSSCQQGTLEECWAPEETWLFPPPAALLLCVLWWPWQPPPEGEGTACPIRPGCVRPGVAGAELFHRGAIGVPPASPLAPSRSWTGAPSLRVAQHVPLPRSWTGAVRRRSEPTLRPATQRRGRSRITMQTTRAQPRRRSSHLQ